MAAIGAAALVIVRTYGDYGMSWDEPYSIEYGRNVVRFFATLGRDRSATVGLVALRGGLFHALIECFALLAPEHALGVRRVLTPLIGLLGIVGTWRLGRLLAGPRAGLLAVLFALLTPLYYGHMFINPADMPFAVGYVWGTYLVISCARALPRPSLRALLGCGLVIGLSTSVRIGGVMLAAYWLALLLVCGALQLREPTTASLGALAQDMARASGAIAAAGYLGMICAWPAALLHPIGVPLEAALQSAAYPKHERVLVHGLYPWSDALPPFYHLEYFAVQLPEVLELCLVIGAGAGAIAMWKALRAREVPRFASEAGTLLAGLAPLLYATLLRPVDYDGVRHFLFLVPLFCCLAARGFSDALTRLEGRHQGARFAATALLVLGLGRGAWSMAELHPYEYTFYNAWTGGTSGARGRYEMDYWVTSFREALLDLGRGAGAAGAPQKLAVCGNQAVAAAYLPPGFELSKHVREAQLVLATTKWACDQSYPGEPVVTVGRAGVPFAVVKRLPWAARFSRDRRATAPTAQLKPQAGDGATAASASAPPAASRLRPRADR